MSARPSTLTLEQYYDTGQLATILPECARWLASELLVNVFPLQPGTKIPYSGFKWLEQASNSPDTVRHWWAHAPFSNIAVPTGACNNIIVLDVDVKHGKDGLKAINLMFGATPADLDFEQWVALIPHTRTPSGGWHVMLPYRPGIPSASFAEGVDIQADGRYVLWSPSWVHGAGFYRYVAAPVAPADGWLS